MKFEFTLLFFILLLCSCSHFQKEKISSETYLKQELNSINWSDVDAYPLFSSCNENTNKSIQKECFENTLYQHVNSTIQQEELISSVSVFDTLMVHITVTNKGEVVISEIISDTLTFATFPDLKDKLYESIQNLPKVEPAIKRGVPVNTRFVMPLVVKTDSL